MASESLRRRWTRDELLLAVHLYWRIPFGQQHSSNQQVMALSRVLDRTPASVAMKLNNLTSLDPEEQARGVRGLPGASALDRRTWAEFEANREVVAAESQALWESRVEGHATAGLDHSRSSGEVRRPTEARALLSVRLGQEFFRRVVLANFGGCCALTGIRHPGLLNASHIVGWADDETHRLNPRNGIALNRLHDAAFDRKLITFDEDLRLVIGRRVRDSLTQDEVSSAFLAYEGRSLRARESHELSPILLGRHREAFARVNA